MRTFFPMNAQAWTLLNEDQTIVRQYLAGEGAGVVEADGGLKLTNGQYLSKRPGAASNLFEVRNKRESWEATRTSGNGGTFNPYGDAEGYGFLLI